MKLKEALHTAARRYLMQRVEEMEAQWPRTAEEWGVAMRDPVRREALSSVIGPWSTAHDLLALVERATPHPPGTAEAVRQWLLDVAFERPVSGRIEDVGRVLVLPEPSPKRRAWRAAEADRFSQYLVGLTDKQLLATEPLPYRRTLNEQEVDVIWKRLRERCDTRPNSWYPRGEPDPLCERLHLRASFMERRQVLDHLRRSLARQAVTRLYELPTVRRDAAREIDLELFDAARDRKRITIDVFWTSPSMDWLIFGSHERMITLGGEDLIGDFKKRVPEWPEGVWASIEDASR